MAPITRLVDEKQLSRLAHVSLGKLQEWRRRGKLRPGVDYRFLDGSPRMLRYPYPTVLERIWELGQGSGLPEGVPSTPAGTGAGPGRRTGPRDAANLDWGR
jgi:hypothetical protein